MEASSSPCLLPIGQYIGTRRRELDARGFLPMVRRAWLVTMLLGKEGVEYVMIFNVDVHAFTKILAGDHQLVVCSL